MTERCVRVVWPMATGSICRHITREKKNNNHKKRIYAVKCLKRCRCQPEFGTSLRWTRVFWHAPLIYLNQISIKLIRRANFLLASWLVNYTSIHIIYMTLTVPESRLCSNAHNSQPTSCTFWTYAGFYQSNIMTSADVNQGIFRFPFEY